MILETERLLLREFEYSDAPFIIELLNSEGWLRYIGNRNVNNRDDAIRYLENGPMKSYASYGFGLSMVELKENRQPVGMCGFIKREELENEDIGFAFLPQHAGNGYAYEIAKATLDYGFDNYKFQKVSAITLPDNERSIRLLKALGMTLESQIRKENETLLLFGISR